MYNGRRRCTAGRTTAATTSRHPPLQPHQLLLPSPITPQELQKLAELKAAGIINDEEFEAKKKQILGL